MVEPTFIFNCRCLIICDDPFRPSVKTGLFLCKEVEEMPEQNKSEVLEVVKNENNQEFINSVKVQIESLKILINTCESSLVCIDQLSEETSIEGNLPNDENLKKIIGQTGFHLDRTAATAQELISVLEKSLN